MLLQLLPIKMEDPDQRMSFVFGFKFVRTNTANRYLAQIPLVKNPAFQTPKPVTLNVNYTKLIPTLFLTVKPPKLNVGVQDIEMWKQDVDNLNQRLDKDNDGTETAKFELWVHQQATKVAPGLGESSQVMQPRVASPPSKSKLERGLSQINELDQVFGATHLN